MSDALAVEYEGRGFSGTIDLSAWLSRAEGDDVEALMGMHLGMPYADVPHGLQQAYRDLAGMDASTDPDTLIFRDQTALLVVLRRERPFLWEVASGCVLRCGKTVDMFGENK